MVLDERGGVILPNVVTSVTFSFLRLSCGHQTFLIANGPSFKILLLLFYICIMMFLT